LQKPILQALLVADRVYTDKDSKKKIIAGVLRKICYFKEVIVADSDDDQAESQAPDKGTLHKKNVLGGVSSTGPAPSIYISLTEVYGTQSFLIRYVNVATDTAKFERKIELTAENPIDTLERVYPMPELPLGIGNVFAVELIWDNETLGSFRIVFDEIDDPRNGEKNDNI